MERAKEQLPLVVKESLFCEGWKAALSFVHQRAGEGEALSAAEAARRFASGEDEPE